MKRFNYLWGRDVSTALTAMEGVVNWSVWLLCPQQMSFRIFPDAHAVDTTASSSAPFFLTRP